MTFLKSKYGIAMLITFAGLILWQLFRVYQLEAAGRDLGFKQVDYEAEDPGTNYDDPANWIGYDTGDGVPPKYK